MKIDLFKTILLIFIAAFLAVFYRYVVAVETRPEKRFEYHDGAILDTKTGAMYSVDYDSEGKKPTREIIFLPLVKE
jgi:hypothetical protein